MLLDVDPRLSAAEVVLRRVSDWSSGLSENPGVAVRPVREQFAFVAHGEQQERTGGLLFLSRRFTSSGLHTTYQRFYHVDESGPPECDVLTVVLP